MGKKTTLDALCPDLASLGLILGPPGQYFGLHMAFPGRFPPTFLAKLLQQVSRNARGNHLEGSWAVFWSLHGLPWEIRTHVPGKVVTPGFQERPWESLLAFGH